MDPKRVVPYDIHKVCKNLNKMGIWPFVTLERISALITMKFRFLKADQDTGEFYIKSYDIEKDLPTWIKEQRHRSFGKCYTIYPNATTREEKCD